MDRVSLRSPGGEKACRSFTPRWVRLWAWLLAKSLFGNEPLRVCAFWPLGVCRAMGTCSDHTHPRLAPQELFVSSSLAPRGCPWARCVHRAFVVHVRSHGDRRRPLHGRLSSRKLGGVGAGVWVSQYDGGRDEPSAPRRNGRETLGWRGDSLRDAFFVGKVKLGAQQASTPRHGCHLSLSTKRTSVSRKRRLVARNSVFTSRQPEPRRAMWNVRKRSF